MKLSARSQKKTMATPSAMKIPISRSGTPPGEVLRRDAALGEFTASPAAAWTIAPASLSARDLPDELSLADDEHAVGHAENLGQLREMRRIVSPCAARRDRAVDVRLRADVDAVRRLVEDQNPRLGGEPLREHDLLLVPPERLRTTCVGDVALILSRP